MYQLTGNLCHGITSSSSNPKEAKRRNDMSDLILPPDAGQTVWIGGIGVQFKLDGAHTHGAFSVVEHPLEPGAFAAPHTHSHEDEFSYVLEEL